MPKATSAEKAARKAEKRRLRNKARLSAVKTYLSKAEKLISGKQVPLAEEAVRQAISVLDRSAQRGAIHPNSAARYKSRLTRKFNMVCKEATPPPAESAAQETKQS